VKHVKRLLKWACTCVHLNCSWTFWAILLYFIVHICFGFISKMWNLSLKLLFLRCPCHILNCHASLNFLNWAYIKSQSLINISMNFDRLLLNHFYSHQKNVVFIVEEFTHYLNCTLLFNIKAISVTVPGEQFLSLAASTSDQVAQDIMNASTDFMEGLFETMTGLPLWKIYRTRGYQKLESSHEVIHR